MCLIALAPKGTDKNSELLTEAIKTAAKTNSDGMGFAFKRAKQRKVYLSKGYNTVEGMLRSIKSKRLKEDDELMVHLRIGNKGAKSKDMCHPFVVADNRDDILQDNTFVKKPVMMHNGTFHLYSEHNSIFSDTYFFIKDFVSHRTIQYMIKEDFTFFKKAFESKLSTNRLAFLFPDQDMKYLGEFIEDSGYFFSNKSYIDSSVRNVGGYEYPVSTNKAGETRNYMNERIAIQNRTNLLTSGSAVSAHHVDDDEWDEWLSAGYGIASHRGKTNSKVGGLVEVAPPKNKTVLNKAGNSDLILAPYDAPIRFDCPIRGTSYRYFMGMWVPNEFKETSQEEAINWVPTEFNYNEFMFKALVDDKDIGLKKDQFYCLSTWDNGATDSKMHCFVRMYGNYNLDFLYVDAKQIHEKFQSFPTTKYVNKYKSYYRLMKSVSPSKTSLKRLLNALKNNDGSKFVNYRGIELLNREAISTAAIIMMMELYPKTYNTEVNLRLANY